MAAVLKLPHAYPFRFHSDVLNRGTLLFATSANDAANRGKVLPTWTVVEAFAQAAGLMAASKETTGGALVQVQRFRCPHPPLPGDRWELTGELLTRMGPLLRVKVTARQNERIRARGIFTIREQKN